MKSGQIPAIVILSCCFLSDIVIICTFGWINSLNSHCILYYSFTFQRFPKYYFKQYTPFVVCITSKIVCNCREEQGRKRVRALQRQLVDIRKEKEVESQQRNEMIAHLKDQLQEMKAKTNMEGKYIKKCAEVSVSQTQKRCNLSEKESREEIEVGAYS